MRTNNLRLILFILSTQIIGCAGQNFSKKIESGDVDLLKEESLMRYNTNRLESMDGAESDFISKALLACHQKKFMKGMSLLESEMHKNKTNPFYWNALGTCYSLNKDYSRALFYYDLGVEALPLVKDQSKVLAEATLANNQGLVHLNFKRYSEAYDSFKRADDLLPNFFTPKFNMAQLYIEFNENEKALDILKKLEAKNPDDIDLLYSLSLIYYRKNDMDKSYAAITRVKPTYLNRPDIVGLYAYNLMKKNRLSEAREIIEKRLYADEYNQRNKILLEEINQKIKEQTKNQK
ncbi:MAG: tetratricopeptide repeat protein [Bacteriovorax sp.]